MTATRRGTDLSARAKRDALGSFLHRFTADFCPEWARSGNYYKYPHFKDDADWLENSLFYIRDDGELDQRYSHCMSTPTWPNGKGINGRKGVDW